MCLLNKKGDFVSCPLSPKKTVSEKQFRGNLMQEEEESNSCCCQIALGGPSTKVASSGKKRVPKEKNPPFLPPPLLVLQPQKRGNLQSAARPILSRFCRRKNLPDFFCAPFLLLPFSLHRCCRVLHSAALLLLRIKRLWRKEEEGGGSHCVGCGAKNCRQKFSRPPSPSLPPAKAAAALPPLSPQPFFNTHTRSPLPFCQNCLSAFVRSGGGGRREGGSAGEISLDLGRGSLPCSACQKPTGRRGRRRRGPFRGAAAGAAAAAVAKFPYILREHKSGRVRLLHRVLWLRMGKENIEEEEGCT